MIKRCQSRLIAGMTVIASVLSASSSPAQDWPTRPATLVYPFAAGSAGDVPGRLFASRLSELLGQPVIFENVGGAGGMIGAARVARARPDGYQILLGSMGTIAVNQTLYKTPLYNAATDFAPVALLVEEPMVLIARNDLPANNLPEFITYAKANHAKMQYGSAGKGSASNLACELLNAAMGVNIAHVPYRGGSSAMQDLMAGRIDFQCLIANAAISQIESKTVKAIALLARDRSPILPNLASALEQGLAKVDVNVWRALFLPKETPAAIIRKLHDATMATLESPSVRERLEKVGITIVARERRSPEYLQRFVESEIQKWAGIMKAAKIRVDSD